MIDCKNIYIEVEPPFSKNLKINEEADCFIILIYLQYKDSLIEFNKIIKMISYEGLKKNIYNSNL